ncbi:MAG TPA: ATP-binding protein [Stellaceae bacterium]|jgi:two-component system sensor histidine kinase RpfC
MSASQSVTVHQESLPPAAFSRAARWVIVALALYAVATPLAVAGFVSLKLVPVPSPDFIMIGLGLTLLGPGLAAITVAWRGLDTVVGDLTIRPDTEPEQAIIRLFIAGAVLVYVAGLAYLGKGGDTILPLLAVGVPGVLTGWLLLVHLMADPEPSLARRGAAMLNDITLISVFLHIGGPYAAPWFSIYLWVVLGFGFRFGIGALAACAVLAAAGFAAVFLSTPYWQLRWPVAAGFGMALVLLPSYAASLVRSLIAAKAEAEEALQAKSRFLAVMSNELHLPLNSVIGMGSLIARTDLDDDQRDMLATMLHSTRTLVSIINDLLDLSKLDGRKIASPIEFFELHEVLGGAIAIVRPQAKAKGLALTLRIDPRLPPAYRGTPLQLRQVVTNLLANAIKSTPKGHIALSSVLIAQGEGRVKLALVVRDEGGGIARDDQQHIFDAFGQADDRQGAEAGLGLAIAKQLVETMGGGIAVQSEIGKGSTLTVTLTLDQDTSGKIRAPDLLGRKLVLISSDPEFAGLLQARLRSWRGEVQWIGNAEQALGELALVGKSERPVVVIVDGTQNPLAGLSLAHRATTAMVMPPVILFIAPTRGSDAIAGLAPSQLAAVIEAPLSDTDLAGALLGILAGDEHMAQLAETEPSVQRVTLAAPAATANPAPNEALATAAATAPAAAPAPQPAEIPSIAAAKPLKILIAEDNPGNMKVLKGVLEGAGHEVEIATDGEAALSALERTRFDLALLDIHMPEVSGYEVTKLYRVGHIGEWRLPIVALTADATSETERLCREAGMDAVLLKPVEAAQLLATLDEIHARLMRPERLAVGAPPMVVTPITAHPRFIPDSAATVDESTFEALRNLGGSDFVFEVVDTFRKDGARIVEQLKGAAERADIREFRDLMHSLRSGAANVGGVKLCQTLTGLRDVSTKDLRSNGAGYVDKIEGEMTRLDAILGQIMESQRR